VRGSSIRWPDGGPKPLWKRPLGFGHSSVVVDESGKRLYTMYRAGRDEAVIALDAATGKSVWEYRYAAPFLRGMNMDVGSGPHSTPLLVGHRLFTTGVTGTLLCLDARSGKVRWRRGIIEELGGTVMARGYSASPLAWRDLLIVTVGGSTHALVALDQRTGRTRWSRHDYANSHSSPILIRMGGEEQAVALMNKVIVGVDPAKGDLLWSHPHDTIGDHTASSPLWSEDGLLFVSSAYNGGSRVVELRRAGGRTSAMELWAHKQMRIHHSNVLRLGDFYFGSSGDFGPSVMQAVHARTGEIKLKSREFRRSNLLKLEDRVLVLDEDGMLALSTFSPEAIQVHGRAQVLEATSWTPPTLVGSKLYLRDRKSVAAFELG
jgi:outer membrane protein assembly factor BamB